MIPWQRTTLILVVGFFLLCLVASFWMTGAHAATLRWDRNTEPDMALYEIYTCTPNPTCTVQQTAVSRIGTVNQVAVGVIPSFPIPAGTEGKIAVSASDTAGNESGLSVPVPFDAKAPAVPVGPRLEP